MGVPMTRRPKFRYAIPMSKKKHLPWFGKARIQRALLGATMALCVFVLPPVAMWLLEHGHFFPAWLFAIWAAVLLISGWTAFKTGLHLFPIYPEKAWFRRLNVMLLTNKGKVTAAAFVTDVGLLGMVLFALTNGEISATAGIAMWLVITYVLAVLISYSRQLHHEGFTLVMEEKRPGAVALHLSALRPRMVVATFSRLNDTVVSSVLDQLRALGVSTIEVASPNGVLTKHAREVFCQRFGETSVVDFLPEPLGRRHSILFKRMLGKQVSVQERHGRLLQSGFIVRI